MADNRFGEAEVCPHPDKVRYDDPRDAAAVLRRAKKRTRGNEVYVCPAPPRHWHIGSPNLRRRRRRHRR